MLMMLPWFWASGTPPPPPNPEKWNFGLVHTRCEKPGSMMRAREGLMRCCGCLGASFFRKKPMVFCEVFVLFVPSRFAAPVMPFWRPPEGPRANPKGRVLEASESLIHSTRACGGGGEGRPVGRARMLLKSMLHGRAFRVGRCCEGGGGGSSTAGKQLH